MKKSLFVVLLVLTCGTKPMIAGGPYNIKTKVSFVGCTYEFKAPWKKVSLRFLSEDTCVLEQRLYCPFPERYSHSIDTLLYYQEYFLEEEEGFTPIIFSVYNPRCEYSYTCYGIDSEFYTDALDFFWWDDVLVNGQRKYSLETDCSEGVDVSFWRAINNLQVGEDLKLDIYRPNLVSLMDGRFSKIVEYYLVLSSGSPIDLERNKPIKFHKNSKYPEAEQEICYKKIYGRNPHPVKRKDLVGHTYTYSGMFIEEFIFDSWHCIYNQWYAHCPDTTLIYQVICDYEIVDNYVVLHKLSSLPSWMDSGESSMQHLASDSIGVSYPELPAYCTINNITNDTLCLRDGVLLYSKVFLKDKQYDFEIKTGRPIPRQQHKSEMENRAYISTEYKNGEEPNITELFRNIYIPLNYYSPLFEKEEPVRKKNDDVMRKRDKVLRAEWENRVRIP